MHGLFGRPHFQPKFEAEMRMDSSERLDTFAVPCLAKALCTVGRALSIWDGPLELS
jgi:hypothetical protein